MTQYDLFISYRRKDTARIVPLVKALESCGLSVWFDQGKIDDFAPITDEIRKGLGDSKALLAWYSSDYPKSRPCQMELTAAFVAAQRDGDPRKRILVVNPEASTAHIEPVELRDEQHASAPDDTPGYTQLAGRISLHVSALQGSLGAIIPVALPQQYGQKLVTTRHFVGRLPDLWRVHSALHAAEGAIITGDSASTLAQLSGMGGIGKSLLAEEYALRFSAAYPGGIFWLRALGNDANRPTLTIEQQDAIRAEQFRLIAIGLGIDVEGLDSAQVEAALRIQFENSKHPFLWIVDDLASGLTADNVRAWLSPHSLGKTLITTRSREYEVIGKTVQLGVLTPQDAFDLLCNYRKPEGSDEEIAAHGIASDLGYHPLAVAVCSRALQADVGLRSFAEFRNGLVRLDEDELELAAEFVDILPSGHEKSVAATLLRSVRTLKPEGRDFLRLASLLATAPIPPSLVAETFARADGLEETKARHRAALGISQAESTSLAERTEDNAPTVHALISRTIRFHESEPDRDTRLRAAAVQTLNEVLVTVADVRSHERLALEVLHARELCTHGLEDTHTATLAAWIGRHDFERGAYAAARSLEEQVLHLRRQILGEGHIDTLAAMNNLATTLHVQGDFPGARNLQQQVLSISCDILGQEHPDTVTAMSNLASTLHVQGDFVGARKLQEHVLAFRRRIYGEEHPDTLTSMNNLAATLNAQGDTLRARQLQEKVLAVRRRILGEEHPETLVAMSNLAATLLALGNLADARNLQEQTLTVSCRVLGKEHPDTSLAASNLIAILLDADDAEALWATFESLAWLLERDPETLSAEQRQIREKIQQVRESLKRGKK